jgi:hypothetical protein
MSGSERALVLFGSIAAIAAWVMIGGALLDPRGRWIAEAFGPPEDGRWVAVEIDKRLVEPGKFTVFIDGGKLRAGRDGCNEWSYSDGHEESQTQMIVTTLVECPEDSISTAYRKLVYGRGKSRLLPNGTLTISVQGHEGRFRREKAT